MCPFLLLCASEDRVTTAFFSSDLLPPVRSRAGGPITMVPTTDSEQTLCLAPSANVLPRAGSGGVSTRQLYLGKEMAGIHGLLQPQLKAKQVLALSGAGRHILSGEQGCQLHKSLHSFGSWLVIPAPPLSDDKA